MGCEWKQVLNDHFLRNAMHLPLINYVSLSTMRNTNGIALATCRTVVFRGMLPEERYSTANLPVLMFYTDKRSQKYADILHNPYGEVCMYLPETRAQFRFTGRFQIVHPCQGLELPGFRRHCWENMSLPAQTQFKSATKNQETEKNVPDNFSILLLIPQFVDFLDLYQDVSKQFLLCRDAKPVSIAQIDAQFVFGQNCHWKVQED